MQALYDQVQLQALDRVVKSTPKACFMKWQIMFFLFDRQMGKSDLADYIVPAVIVGGGGIVSEFD